jgi:hypothetical protein
MLMLGWSLITVLVLLWVAFRIYRKYKSPKLKVSPRKMLMDKLVRDFKSQLERAVGEDYDVYPHVRLADLLVIAPDKDKKAQQIKSRIEATSTDLVLTEKATGRIACVLILIHQDKLGSRQQFIRQICQQGKLPFQIFDVNNAFSDKQIREAITRLLEPMIRLDESPSHDIKVYLDPGEAAQQRQEAESESREQYEKKPIPDPNPGEQQNDDKAEPERKRRYQQVTEAEHRLAGQGHKKQEPEPKLREQSHIEQEAKPEPKVQYQQTTEAERRLAGRGPKKQEAELKPRERAHKQQKAEPEFDLSVD